MKTIPVRDLRGTQIGEEKFDDALVTMPVRQDILHAAVVAYLANQRQGTAAAKTRAEVSGSGRKPWRQKGTGRARVGETRNPVWRHGGVVFAPKPRDYSVRLPKRVRRAALREALRDKLMQDGGMTILALDALDQPKTRVFAAFLKQAGIAGSTLFVVSRDKLSEQVERCVKNLRSASCVHADQMHAYGVLNSDCLVVLDKALPEVRAVLGAREADKARRTEP